MRVLAILVALTALWTAPVTGEPYVSIQTSVGDIVVDLDAENAPATVANFLQYAEDGHYDRTIVHRVVKGFVIQGGGYSQYFSERRTREPVAYEGDNGLTNTRGAIAMARTQDPESATAQWYINVKDNPRLDHRMGDFGPIFGYTVFGEVIEGMEVVDAINAVETADGGPFPSEVPIEAIVIKRVDILDQYKVQ